MGVTLTYTSLPNTSALHTQIPNSQPKWSSRSVSTDLAVLAALSSAMPSSTRTLTSLPATTRSLSLTTPPTCSSTTPHGEGPGRHPVVRDRRRVHRRVHRCLHHHREGSGSLEGRRQEGRHLRSFR